jgi:hypothetical protein
LAFQKGIRTPKVVAVVVDFVVVVADFVVIVDVLLLLLLLLGIVVGNFSFHMFLLVATVAFI